LENFQPFPVKPFDFHNALKAYRRSIDLIKPIKRTVERINSIQLSTMELLRNQTGESLPLMSRGNSHSLHNVVYPSQMSHRNAFALRTLSKTHLVTELTYATLVADAFDDAVVASVMASNGTGIAKVFDEQAGWSKGSIMEIAFGIVGTMLGVAAVWLGVRLYRELTPLFSRVAGWEMVL
jgi:hypothetical protein